MEENEIDQRTAAPNTGYKCETCQNNLLYSTTECQECHDFYYNPCDDGSCGKCSECEDNMLEKLVYHGGEALISPLDNKDKACDDGDHKGQGPLLQEQTREFQCVVIPEEYELACTEKEVWQKAEEYIADVIDQGYVATVTIKVKYTKKVRSNTN